MKKNLRNVLALFLGLMTTVSFAQDWNVDSRTRMDMSEAINGTNTNEGYKMTNQRVTLGATWVGSDWAIHLSSDANYTLGVSADPSMSIYEAYASANLMGMASVTAGRQALNYGSGALMGTNDWNNDRNTWDGLTFGFDLDMADVTVGYASANSGPDVITGLATEDKNNMWVNLGGEFSGWNVNVLYLTDTDKDDAAYGLDISGGLMGASVSGSMNTDYAGNTMRVVNLGYAVTDDINISVGQTAYGDENYVVADGGRQTSFKMDNSNMNGSWADNGGIGYLMAGDEDLTYGLSYTMGGISLGATMHRITNTMDENYERSAMEVNLGYALGNNASLGLKYITDDNGITDGSVDESKYTWLTLTVTP